MAWIYLAESEESQKLSKDMCARSPTVKTTDTHKGFSYHEWLEETCRLHQYGMTLPHYGEPTFQASILSMEDSHAKTFPTQEAKRVWKESKANFILRSLGLCAKFDQTSCSWRTYQRLLFEAFDELLTILPNCGMTCDGRLYQLMTSGRRSLENGGSLWLTPTKADAANRAWSVNSRGEPKLSAQLKQAGRLNGEIKSDLGNQDIQANPEWMETLMGYAIGWTVAQPWVIAWYRPKRAKRLKGSSVLKKRNSPSVK